MAAGYVYVLANSSMPGLVKVGKTTRQPSERADELSGVTGVATPFIVVYEEHFEDCDAVEAHLHTALAARGLRLSESREFFRAAVSDIVKIIVSVRKPTVHRAQPVSDELADLLSPDDPELEGFQLDGYHVPEPWEALMKEADRHFYGNDGYLEDHSEAFKLYRDAARLGSPQAYERLGHMYRCGLGVREDRQSALDCYKEGAKKGDYFCYAGMADIFAIVGHAENTRKALSRFILGGEADRWKADHLGLRVDRIKFILAPIKNNAAVDRGLLLVARAYLPQVRAALQKDLGVDGLANKYQYIKPSLVDLLSAIDASQL